MSEPVTINLRHVARDLNFPAEKVQATVELLDAGHPVPFIVRYRKDETGNLDEDQVRAIQDELSTQRALAERKQAILKSLESLDKLSPELERKIRDAKSSKRLEDIYLPYKPKRHTLASAAKEKGLEPLAFEILEAKIPPEELDKRAEDFVNTDKGVATPADALLGAGHIISEIFSEKLELRQHVRDIVQRVAVLTTKKIETKPADEEKPAKPPKTPKPKKGAAPSDSLPGETLESENTVSSELLAAETTQEEPVEMNAQPVQPEEVAAIETPAEPRTEDASEGSGSGGGEDETSPSNTPEVPPAETTEISATVETPSVETPSVETPSVETPSVETPSVETPSVEIPPVETAAKDDSENSPTAPTPEAAPAAEKDIADEVTEQFQQWKETLKEQGLPVVRSQNQIKKKQKAEKKKQKSVTQDKQREQFENLFHDFFDFNAELRKLTPHRVLAINRGEKAKVIRAKIEAPSDSISQSAGEICVPKDHPHAAFLNGCVNDALDRLVLPSLEREVRNDLTDNAEAHAVKVFAKNLRNLLLQPPLLRKRVLAMDPGFRHGCKLVALDEFGNVLAYETIYLVGIAEKREKAAKVVVELIEKFKLTVLAIGNGTACRETEDFVSAILAEKLEGKEVSYAIVNEAGASVYSASPIAREEFPDYDVLLRGAVSIGRRLQDPLNELVKVEPASLGVGMYQHDVKAKYLKDSLDAVVESCVNFVGVDLNSATPAILRFVSGLNQLTAKRIYDYRMANGPFKTREDLKKVQGFGDVAFTHSAGFLRITDGFNPLDATWIHPESYDLATKILEKLGYGPDDLRNSEKSREIVEKSKTADPDALAVELQTGPLKVRDILAQFAKPGRDPREELPPPIFKKGVLKLEDLSVGMELTGTILNVVDFGAFVDVGLHDSGLIHISQMADRYVKDAHEIVSVGDIVRVWVVEVDGDRHRISLSMISPTAVRSERRHGEGDGHGGERSPKPRRDSGPKSAAAQGRALPPSQAQPKRDSGPKSVQAELLAQGKIIPEYNESQERPPRDDRDRGPRRDSTDSRQRRDGSESGGHKRDTDKFRGGGGAGRSDRDRGRNHDRDRRSDVPKVYVAPAKEKVVAPISENMKKGKEPLRSFGDLAQLFGRVEVTEPESKKKKKEKNNGADAPQE